MIHEANDLCSKVLWAHYGDPVAKDVMNATGPDLIWWCDIFKLCFEDDGGTCWFDVGVRRRVENGCATRFWKDTWCGGTPLNVSFQKLFHLSLQKIETIKNLGTKTKAVGLGPLNGGGV